MSQGNSMYNILNKEKCLSSKPEKGTVKQVLPGGLVPVEGVGI
jgi:hypothetical protein